MSYRVGQGYITGAYVVGTPELGTLGANVPNDGLDFPSALYPRVVEGGYQANEVRLLILTQPSAGTLFVWPDGRFKFEGAPDGTYTWSYRLYVDGVAGSVYTVQMQIGAGGDIHADVSVTIGTITLTTTVSLVVQAASSASVGLGLAGGASVVIQGSVAITMDPLVLHATAGDYNFVPSPARTWRIPATNRTYMVE